MTTAIDVPPKKPTAVEPYFFVLCDEDGTNASSTTNDGELAGATINSFVIVATNGITIDSSNKAAVTVEGIAYAINTVVTVWLSGGTDNNEYDLTCTAPLSDGRTFVGTIHVPVRA